LIGLLPIVFGALVYLWCAWDFVFAGKGTPAPIDPPRALVVRGLYRKVRNPMYVGVMSILVGEAVIFESWKLLGCGAVFGLAAHLFVVFYEEPTLKKKFGTAYEEYCQAVPRWIPRLRAPGRNGCRCPGT
jgi:protein-S-isoprenylcysteine O-methyltransferase Ste14